MTDRSVKWARISPPEPCASPDGHKAVAIMADSSSIPVAVRCVRCGRSFQVVVFEGDE